MTIVADVDVKQYYCKCLYERLVMWLRWQQTHIMEHQTFCCQQIVRKTFCVKKYFLTRALLSFFTFIFVFVRLLYFGLHSQHEEVRLCVGVECLLSICQRFQVNNKNCQYPI